MGRVAPWGQGNRLIGCSICEPLPTEQHGAGGAPVHPVDGADCRRFRLLAVGTKRRGRHSARLGSSIESAWSVLRAATQPTGPRTLVGVSLYSGGEGAEGTEVASNPPLPSSASSLLAVSKQSTSLDVSRAQEPE